METFKAVPIAEFAEFYEVSNLGRIRRSKDSGKSRQGRAGSLIRGIVDAKGYNRVVLSVNGRRLSTFRHRLVALAFVPGDASLDVNHKDGVKLNCVPSNLEWVTKAGNNEHAIRTGLWRPAEHSLGARKLTGAQVTEIRERCSIDSTIRHRDALAKEFKVSRSVITWVISGRCYRDVPMSSISNSALPQGEIRL